MNHQCSARSAAMEDKNANTGTINVYTVTVYLKLLSSMSSGKNLQTAWKLEKYEHKSIDHKKGG